MYKRQLLILAERVGKLKDNVKTEEATKTSFVLPFLQALGYDIFNPEEVTPCLLYTSVPILITAPLSAAIGFTKLPKSRQSEIVKPCLLYTSRKDRLLGLRRTDRLLGRRRTDRLQMCIRDRYEYVA